MASTPEGIVATIRRAIVNYGSFAHEDVEQAVLSGLNELDADLVEGNYAQSSRADAAVAKLEEAMSTADAAREEKSAEGETETE